MKLSYKTKLEVVSGVMHKKFSQDVKDYYEDMHKIILDVAEKHYKDFDFEGAKKFGDYITYTNSIYTYRSNYSGPANTLCYRKALEELLLNDLGKEATHLYLDSDKYPTRDSNIVLENELSKDRFEELKVKLEERGTLFYSLMEKMRKVKSELWTVLNSCTTDKQLGEVLPELLPFIPNKEVLSVAVVSGEIVESVKSLLLEVENEEKLKDM